MCTSIETKRGPEENSMHGRIGYNMFEGFKEKLAEEEHEEEKRRTWGV